MSPLNRCRRVWWTGVLLLALVGAACSGDPNAPGPPLGSPTVDEMARAVGADVAAHMARGYVPGRSGDILLAPEPWNVLGQWNNGLRGPNDPRTTHASPWSYHQRVPLILYGPGYVRPGVRSQRSVDVADLAPTFADLLGFPFAAPDGEVLGGALEPPGQRPGPPRAIILVAYDGGGWNVLEQWPEAWPVLRGLAQQGATYLNATVGSSPSLTAPVHATMGTGGYPRYHGLPENTARRPDGEISELFYKVADPVLLRGPTVADAWDQSTGNRSWVGLLGFESWHLGMMGKGARFAGGDHDVAILWDREEFDFRTNEEAYRLPTYLPEADALDTLLEELDARDGARDGRWMGNDLFSGDTFILPGTPAFVDLQSEVLARLFRHEPIGRDDVSDFLFVEMKSTDYAGHIWNMRKPEVREVLKAQDRMLSMLVSTLNRTVGVGRWVLALTADHGQTPVPTSTGGLRIDRVQLENDIDEYFGADIVEALHPTELYLDRDAIRDAGITVEEVARYVGNYRYRDGLPEGADAEGIPAELLDRRVFAAALPGSVLRSMTPAEVAALGPGVYPEGDLTSPPGYDDLLTR
jgi:predicted AlkP superfamily pyrophosphatase or phosphodiesterase